MNGEREREEETMSEGEREGRGYIVTVMYV